MKVKCGKRRSTIKQRPTRKERRTPPSVYEQACLLSGGRWVRGPGRIGGECFGGTCPLCKGQKTDPRGMKFIHKKRRKMGGTTSSEIHSIENVVWGCYVCDDENDGVILPKQRPSEDTDLLRMLSGRGDGRGPKYYIAQMKKKEKQKE